MVPAGNEARAPLPLGQLLAVTGNHDDEGREILIRGPQSVGHPRAEARPTGNLETGLHERHSGIVIDLLGVHRLDEAEIVDDLRRVRHQLADPGPRLSILLESECRWRDRERCLIRAHGGEPLALPDRVGQIHSPHFRELWLVVEELQLRRPAALKQINDSLGLRSKVRQAL